MLWSRVRIASVALAVAVSAAACSSGTVPTATPTPVVRTATSAPTAATTPAATTVATPVATAAQPPASFDKIGVIGSAEQCFRENESVKALDLPRQILSLSPAMVRDGDTLTLSGAGYRPRSALEVRVFIPGTGRVSQPLTQMLTDEAGRASGSFVLSSVKLLNTPGDTSVPVCMGVVLWSPTEVGGGTILILPQG